MGDSHPYCRKGRWTRLPANDDDTTNRQQNGAYSPQGHEHLVIVGLDLIVQHEIRTHEKGNVQYGPLLHGLIQTNHQISAFPVGAVVLLFDDRRPNERRPLCGSHALSPLLRQWIAFVEHVRRYLARIQITETVPQLVPKHHLIVVYVESRGKE